MLDHSVRTLSDVFYISAEKLKREFDKVFGAPWNVIVGEAFSFNVDYDFHFLYYFLYGPVAILAWRVSCTLILVHIRNEFELLSVEVFYLVKSIISLNAKWDLKGKIQWWWKRKRNSPIVFRKVFILIQVFIFLNRF